eukprot:Hpha_TRINITY_DN29793_c0_g1::TRINITY_DN29793_c0_g1_i1::g.2597::m.2597
MNVRGTRLGRGPDCAHHLELYFIHPSGSGGCALAEPAACVVVRVGDVPVGDAGTLLGRRTDDRKGISDGRNDERLLIGEPAPRPRGTPIPLPKPPAPRLLRGVPSSKRGDLASRLARILPPLLPKAGRPGTLPRLLVLSSRKRGLVTAEPRPAPMGILSSGKRGDEFDAGPPKAEALSPLCVLKLLRVPSATLKLLELSSRTREACFPRPLSERYDTTESFRVSSPSGAVTDTMLSSAMYSPPLSTVFPSPSFGEEGGDSTNEMARLRRRSFSSACLRVLSFSCSRLKRSIPRRCRRWRAR